MQKISLEEFEKIINGKYFFHFHTTFTDGKSKVKDYFDFANKHGIKTLIFTEHVRRKLSYEFDDLLEHIEKENILNPNIKAIVGVEAKILPGGRLDIPENILSKIQLIGFACHSFPNDIELYQDSFERLFSEKKWRKYIRVWVHPGRFLKRIIIPKNRTGVLKELVKYAEKQDVFLEKNMRKPLDYFDVLSICDKDRIIVGHDAHSVKAIEKIAP